MTYPTTLDTAATLQTAANNLATTLTASYTSPAASLSVADASGIPSTGGTLYVGGERCTYSGTGAGTVTGVAGLTNNYAAGTVVELLFDASHYNGLRDAVLALEGKVGTTGSADANSLDYKVAQKPDLSGADPAALGAVAPGTASSAARSDHVHPTTGLALAGVATSSGLTVSATDKLLGRSTAGAGAVEEIACTAAGRALLDDADTAAQRTTLGAAASGAMTSSGITIATARLAGRTTAGTGALEEVSVGDGLVLESGVLATRIAQNSQSTAYTAVIGDAGKHLLHPSADASARTFTIPANGSVAYPIGTAITFVNQNGAGTMTIAITTDTMRLAGAGTTGSRTLAANGIATALKITSTEWIISGTGLT